MKEEFLSKLNNNEYIPLTLFNSIKISYNELIPKEFDIERYNNRVLEKEYIRYKDYFDSMYNGVDPNIKLDKDQIKAILADEDYSLIIAGAGTGKTTTMASKVKYLVDIKKVAPSKILVMSYTKKATEELEKRITLDFGIPARVTTFHSLGMMYIREIFKNNKCNVVDDNKRDEIFLKYFKENIFPYKEKVKEIIECFNTEDSTENVIGKHFTQNYEYFSTYDRYFNYYKKCKLKEVKDLRKEIYDRINNRLNNEIPISIKNEFMKSKGEALIANFLFCNNIEYSYEHVYRELMNDNRVYKPDFTLELAGDKVYIEYFGLSNYNKSTLNRYDKIRKMKEDYHREHHTKFIALDYDKNESILKKLKTELLKMGFTLKPKSNEEIFYALLGSNQLTPINKFKDLVYDCIDTIKSYPNRSEYKNIVNSYINTLKEDKESKNIQFKYINDFYKYYQNSIFGTNEYGFDFSDMIYYANKYINTVNSNGTLNFKYIIIDEYQDISQDRYELTKSISNINGAKVVAVGDDWQSIFAFAGSKIQYIYNFQKYFNGAKLFKINRTYRNSQELINYSGEFIMKNNKQIKKGLVSNKSIKNPIKFVPFDDGLEYQVLKELILQIHKHKPNHKIMILARKNRLINKCFMDKDLKNGVNTKIKFVGYKDLDIDGMTMHKSKGLTSDEVILIGLDNTFPSNRTPYWFIKLFRPITLDEPIEFAEERRLFYVALTRTKNNVFLLVNNNPKHRSPFINEIYQIVKEVNNKIKIN